MNFHPTLIALHIADTTAGACRQKRRRMGQSITGALVILAAVLYFGARMA